MKNKQKERYRTYLNRIGYGKIVLLGAVGGVMSYFITKEGPILDRLINFVFALLTFFAMGAIIYYTDKKNKF